MVYNGLRMRIVSIIVASSVSLGISSASDLSLGSVKSTIWGLGSLEAGQLVKGENYASETDQANKIVRHVWYERLYMDLGVKAAIDERTHIIIAGEIQGLYSWRKQPEQYDELMPRYIIYPHHVEGSYAFGNIERPILKIGVGIMPFKYNPDVRNLGEYLFRTGTYPPYMLNEFDFPLARITGLQLSSTPIDNLHFTALFNSESRLVPLGDWGIALLGDYTVLKMFTCGAGVFFNNLLPVNDNYTTPKGSGMDLNLAPLDSTNGDTVWYTFSGTKIMARFSFDPKVFIPLDIFGQNDLRLYGEIAVLGWKNYPKYYNDRYRRMPIMLGFNFPTFKVLDVTAMELEFYTYNFPNSYKNVFFDKNFPIPDYGTPYDWKQNQYKWSIYTQKRLGKCFTLTGQVAKDHMRLFRFMRTKTDNDLQESMHKLGDWAWILKTQFSF